MLALDVAGPAVASQPLRRPSLLDFGVFTFNFYLSAFFLLSPNSPPA